MNHKVTAKIPGVSQVAVSPVLRNPQTPRGKFRYIINNRGGILTMCCRLFEKGSRHITFPGAFAAKLLLHRIADPAKKHVRLNSESALQGF